MKPGELNRIRFVFGALGAVPAFLLGWLGWLQVAEGGELTPKGRAPLPLVAATADRQSFRREPLPAPRGTILDRHGSVLAVDCEAYEVRARIVTPGSARADGQQFAAWLDRLVADIAACLVADPDQAQRLPAHAQHQRRLDRVLGAAFHRDQLPASGKLPASHPWVADVLLAEVDSLAVIEALRALPQRRENAGVELHFLRSYRRAYPDRELTHGIVGHCSSDWIEPQGAARRELTTFGVCGLETMAVLTPDDATFRAFRRDGKGRPYFLAPVDQMPRPNVLRSTLDLELQRIAARELATEASAGAREGTITVPKWGALVLLEIESGDVLAAASWHRDGGRPEATAFTPYQSLFEPGSIVKPLVLAYAFEAGTLDWSQEFDCAPGSATYRERIAGLGRAKPVRDDHDCHLLTPHGILVNSSNIGATYVGLGLAREQWRDYMRFFGFGESLGLRLPHEARGGPNRRSFASSTSPRSFRANSAVSFSFGYELQTSTLQIARAYLRLFRGAAAELRLCRSVQVDGRWQAVPTPASSGPRFRPEVVDAVRAAMVDVISAEPGATGFHLHGSMLKETGIDLHGLVGGKTGTAASMIGLAGGGSISARNASFVGILPAHAPRWLAVCVLQKDDSARFYGGRYAAPPAVRLLLQCQQLEQRRQLPGESPSGTDGQVRAETGSPGDSGWGQVPQRQGQ